MTDKELLKQALNALEGLFGVHRESAGVAVWQLGGSHEPKEAITALRQANKQVAIKTHVPPGSEWVGLTAEEVEKIVDDNTQDDQGYDIWCNGKDVAAIVEAKLKEKNT